MPEIGRSCFAAEAARGVIPDFGPKSELPESQECAEAIFVRFEVNRGCLNRLSEINFQLLPSFPIFVFVKTGSGSGRCVGAEEFEF